MFFKHTLKGNNCWDVGLIKRKDPLWNAYKRKFASKIILKEVNS